MKALSIILILAGLTGQICFAFGYDTTLETTGYTRVHNIGREGNRMVGVVIFSSIFLAGVVCACAAGSKSRGKVVVRQASQASDGEPPETNASDNAPAPANDAQDTPALSIMPVVVLFGILIAVSIILYIFVSVLGHR